MATTSKDFRVKNGLVTEGAVTATGNVSGNNLLATNSNGDEGGEILLSKPVTNTTIAGTAVTVDIYQNKLRFFENGGTSRGYYLDITAGGAGSGTNLASAGGTTTNALTIGTGLSGTSFNGSTAVTIANTGVLSVNGSNGAITGIATTAGNLSQFAATTSSQLAGVISDETGSGALVFATSPTLVTPSIGVATGTSFNSITGLSSTTPIVDGTAAVGTATTVARADHVHPTPTSVVATVSGTNSADLVYGNMADNDQFRIRVGGTASNAGFVELATADDGTEPIYVRQYTGVFTTLARTATLLDGSGNTTFPGTVSASGLAGSLLTSTVGTNIGTASAGTSAIPARSDHVHPTTGLGLTSSGLNQFAATTSSQLAGVISDETGSGSLVFANSPTLVTPVLGVATGTSFNSITGLASTTSPMNGAAAVGTGTTVARVDHVHPTDTSRAPLASPTFTGTVTVPSPTNATDAATKQYVDDVAQGLHIHPSVVAATTANLTATYSNGTSGVGATLTNSGTLAAFSTDGVSPAQNDRVLVKNQTTQLQNGIYTLTTVGSGSVAWVLTRANDMDQSAEVDGGDFVFVTGGSTLDNTGWVQTEIGVTVGTSSLIFTQFSGAGTYTAGNGLTLNANQFVINTAITADLSTAQTLTNKTLTSPTLTTPSIGVATGTSFNSITGLSSTAPSANGTAAVGTATTTARADHVHPTTGLGLTSGTLAQFAATTSSQLAGVISDETGSGALVFATSPTLVTPSIGVATGTSFNSITGLSSTAPSANGTAAVGTATTTARADHVHPISALTIGTGLSGTSYNGSSAVTIANTGVLSVNGSTGAVTGIATSGANSNITSLTGLTTPLSATQGGTAQSTYATGDIVYASASNTLAKRTIGSTGEVLTVVGGVPTWAAAGGGGSGADNDTYYAQMSLSGGGIVTWTGTNLKWSQRVIAIPVENTEFGAQGYIDINCPTSGTITYYNASNVTTTLTCTANGVPLGPWEALYYQVTPGQGSTSDQTKFRVVAYQNTTWSPTTGWILLATTNGEGSGTGGHLRWLPGQINLPTQTNNTAIYKTGSGETSWNPDTVMAIMGAY